MERAQFEAILLGPKPSGINWFPEVEDIWRVSGELEDGEAAEWRSRLEHGTRVFLEFGDWIEQHGFPAADTAADRIFGSPFYVGMSLSWSEVPLDERLAFVAAAKEPFQCIRRRFPKLSFRTNLFMLWDQVCHGFTDPITGWDEDLPDGERRRPVLHLSGDQKIVHDAMFDALVELLQHPDEWVQDSALHGLGHSRHPKAAETVQAYIDAYPDELEGRALEWCEECRDGSVM